MKKSSLFEEYWQKYSVGEKWRITANAVDHVSQIVVIPALAERESLFYTLASLAKNHPSSLEDSLILCVVNNKGDAPADVVANNLHTLNYLDHLIRRKSLRAFVGDRELHALLTSIAEANMNMGYMDASSPGCEMPLDKGGVGLARKIGMDTALRFLQKNSSSARIIMSLDADTLVQNNYLSVVKNHFVKGAKTAIVAYEHQMPADERGRAAICCYEIFLRYWVLALNYAQSPWAFHSIGSTFSVSPDAYLAVRGMNKREAGEDFYFLNKLAKVGHVDYIKNTCVYPSARLSTRVPFGTGKRIQRFLEGSCREEYCLYDPRIFSVLADWLRLMRMMILESENRIMKEAALIHPHLKYYLEESQFSTVWSKIRHITTNEKLLTRHFHDWFDGFRTLKLINYFTREVYPQINMFSALENILALSGRTMPAFNHSDEIPPLPKQIEILQGLRSIT